jgi:hypothetical protein
MRRILIIPIFFLFTLEQCSQSEKRFSFEKMTSGSYLVTPTFNEPKAVGDLGKLYILDSKYIYDLFIDPIKKSIPKEKLDSLNNGSEARITFDIKGDVINCDFILNIKDRNVFSQDDLYNLYQGFRQVKINMSKVRLEPDVYIKSKSADYAFITVDLIPRGLLDYDCIDRNKIYLIRTGSDTTGSSKLSALKINSVKKAEQLFGPCNKMQKLLDNSVDENYNQLLYNDGLRLEIYDKSKDGAYFTITSDKYTMLLENGRAIRVGMPANDLKVIFPNSYIRRKVSFDSESKSNITSMMVYFCFTRDNQVFIETAWMTFILNGGKGILEKFYSYFPN